MARSQGSVAAFAGQTALNQTALKAKLTPSFAI
jgi:hypothetical protein